MMIDSRWEIWDNQALTVAEESRTNGNMFDLEENGVTDEQISSGLWFNFIVGTAFTTLTEGWYMAVLNSDSATFATGSLGDKCIAAIGCYAYPLPVADLAAGKAYSIALPRWNLLKYLEAYFCPISTAAGAGNLDAWFGLAPISPTKVQKAPDGYTITAN